MLACLFAAALLAYPPDAAPAPSIPAPALQPVATFMEVLSAQDPAPGEEPPPAPAPTVSQPPPGSVQRSAPPPVPDRWLLMKSLQGTWYGDLLDGNHTQISGWIEGSFTAGTIGHNQLPLSFNYRGDEPVVQQAWLRVDHPVITSGTTDPTFGFRSDWLFGTDYSFTLPRGIFNSQLTARNGEPNIYGVDPVQFYGEFYVPTVAQGLDIKLGRFFSPFGAENIDAVSNALLSHSYCFNNGPPYTNAGVLATLALTPVWQVQGGLVLGSDIVEFTSAAQPTLIGGVQWTQPGGNNVVKLVTILNSGRFNTAAQQNNYNEVDLVWQHIIARGQLAGATAPILTYNLEILAGYETNLPDETTPDGRSVHIGTASFIGVVNYLNATLSPRLTATARLEFFNDPQGARTQTAPGATVEDTRGLYTAVTLGLAFKPTSDVILLPELRYDYNDESRAFSGNHGLLTAGLGIILRF
jgi:hypothetical protein